uniref:Uncharacterized protein LOC107430238 n=1 Tax=Rhizophora mucronata TaxID=61149 RepID=A0A2P2ILV6_RHIMU
MASSRSNGLLVVARTRMPSTLFCCKLTPLSLELILYLPHGFMLPDLSLLSKHAIDLIYKSESWGNLGCLIFTRPFGSDGRHGDIDEVCSSLHGNCPGQHCLPHSRRPKQQDFPARFKKSSIKEVWSSKRKHS